MRSRSDGRIQGGSEAHEPHDDVPVTVTEAVEVLRRHGYTADFELVDGALRTDAGNASCPLGDAVVERLYRFEGPSDPGDQMIVFGLLDPLSEIRGTLAAAFGPSADPALYDHLTGSGTRWNSR
jgi:hypothetical protein